MNIKYLCSKLPSHYEGIYQLQKKNLETRISKEEAQTQGFVSIDHSIDLLTKMGQEYGHAIAVVEDTVIGFALVMLREFRNEIPVLVPMFDQIDKAIAEKDLDQLKNYFVMGQVCVAKEFRGAGVFKNLYNCLCKQLTNDFDCVITEISGRNTRSLHAHKKIGFQNLHTYEHPTEGPWEIVYLNIN